MFVRAKGGVWKLINCLKMKKLVYLLLLPFLLSACNSNRLKYDAAGVFEATEVVVSSEVSGVVQQFDIAEGDELIAGQRIGTIDSTQLYLQKLQLIGSQRALEVSRPDVRKQIAVAQEELERIRREKTRIEKLFKGGAATEQQLDECTAQLRMAEARLAAQENSLTINSEGIAEQSSTITIQIAQLEDKLRRCRIINPVKGTVLKKYVERGELVAPFRPLYRIANLDTMYLRAYLTSDQISKTRLGQEVRLYSDYGQSGRREYVGRIVWSSARAEFTPKTIQTRDERANLVYAVKIATTNDGLLKIGMYGEVALEN